MAGLARLQYKKIENVVKLGLSQKGSPFSFLTVVP
jgi:hypothetical protein